MNKQVLRVSVQKLLVDQLYQLDQTTWHLLKKEISWTRLLERNACDQSAHRHHQE
jgi:hypothetical protein